MIIRTLESVIQSEARTSPQLPLSPGDRLTHAEFERRYQAHPEIKKAELIGGDVRDRGRRRTAVCDGGHR